MQRTAFGCKSNRGAQTWLGQALGAVLPDGSSRSLSQAPSSVPNTMIAYFRSYESPERPTLSSLPSASDPHPEIEPAINTHRATRGRCCFRETSSDKTHCVFWRETRLRGCLWLFLLGR